MSVEFFYVGNIFDAVKAGIIGLHAENFIVLFAGVYHLEQANSALLGEHTRKSGSFPKISASTGSPSSALVSGMNP